MPCPPPVHGRALGRAGIGGGVRGVGGGGSRKEPPVDQKRYEKQHQGGGDAEDGQAQSLVGPHHGKEAPGLQLGELRMVRGVGAEGVQRRCEHGVLGALGQPEGDRIGHEVARGSGARVQGSGADGPCRLLGTLRPNGNGASGVADDGRAAGARPRLCCGGARGDGPGSCQLATMDGSGAHGRILS